MTGFPFLSAEKKQLFPLQCAIAVAAFLAAVKLVVGLWSHSMGVLAASLDSVMDLFVSSFNLISLRHALQPPDADHAYGHGKVESIAGMFQGVLIALSGMVVIGESIRRMIQGTHVVHVTPAVAVMIFACLSSAGLVWYLRRAAQRYRSMVLQAEQLHYASDVLTNLGVVLTLGLVQWTGRVVWDLVVSLLIGFYIIQVAFKLSKEAYNELMDRELPPSLRRQLEAIILHFDKRIAGYHNLRTRKVGGRKFVEFHVVIHGEKEFKAAHDLTEALIVEIEKRIPDCDVTVHADYEDDGLRT